MKLIDLHDNQEQRDRLLGSVSTYGLFPLSGEGEFWNRVPVSLRIAWIS